MCAVAAAGEQSVDCDWLSVCVLVPGALRALDQYPNTYFSRVFQPEQQRCVIGVKRLPHCTFTPTSALMCGVFVGVTLDDTDCGGVQD